MAAAALFAPASTKAATDVLKLRREIADGPAGRETKGQGMRFSSGEERAD
jgi:hypothetical protein